MAKQLMNAEQVKKVLGIESFRNITKDKVVEFVSLIPHMEKEVAITIINQFPSYVEMAKSIIAELNGMCETAMDKAAESQKDVIAAYKLILVDLGKLLEKEYLTEGERDKITDKMILVANKIAEKDSEYKAFLVNVVKAVSPIIGGVLMLGAVILGVNAKGIKFPELKNRI